VSSKEFEYLNVHTLWGDLLLGLALAAINDMKKNLPGTWFWENDCCIGFLQFIVYAIFLVATLCWSHYYDQDGS
jgi:hypothetical protein